MRQMSLRTFLHTHLEVDGVTLNILLHRVNAREHVTVVVIEVADSILIILQSLVKQLLVVDIARVHAEHTLQVVRVVNSITDPVNLTDIIFLAFRYLEPDIDMLRIIVPYTVGKDGGVAVTKLIVFFNEFLLVFLPALRSELLCFEESGEFTSLMRLSESAFLEEPALDL